MRSSKAFFILSLAAFTAVSSRADGVKVGVVFLQKALQQVKKGKDAKSTLEKEFDAKKKDIEKRQKELQSLQEEFQKKAAVMSDAARGEKQMQMQQKYGQYQELVQKSQAEIQTREGELTHPIIDGLRDLVSEVSRAQKLDLVFEGATGGLLYSTNQTDITEELIRLYDEKNPAKKKK